MSTRLRIAAIIPAAGRSTRMGDVKQLLPVGGAPMAIKIAGELLAGGCGAVVLTTRSELVDQFGALPTGMYCVVNDDPAAEMIDSVRVGLRFWQSRVSGEPFDGFLVCPGDAAYVAAADVRQCLKRFADDALGIVVASHGGRGGHPVVFSASLTDAVLSEICNAGLNQLARAMPNRVRRVECGSPGVLSNVNRPEDLRPK